VESGICKAGAKGEKILVFRLFFDDSVVIIVFFAAISANGNPQVLISFSLHLKAEVRDI